MRYPPRPAFRVAAAVATVSALALSACGIEDDPDGSADPTAAAPPSETVTVTEEVPVEEPAGEDDADCEVDPESAVTTDGIDNLPPPGLADSTWVYKGDLNFNVCDDLTYATVEQDPQGNAQFENKPMLFHQGGYSGFPQADAPQQHTVVDTTEDSVTVEFKDWEALDEAGGANVEAPNYTEEVTFRWVDGTVVTEGRIPNEP